MRSYNDAALLPRTLEALDRQVGVDIALAVFESASKDNSVEIFEAHGYARMFQLEPGTYRSSAVLNQGAREAETEVVVFLNSDAILLQDDALAKMATRLLANEKTAGVYARQTARDDADAMTQLEYVQAFERREELGAAGTWMTLVCSAVRKSVWEKVPFNERLTFAEDAVWSVEVQKLGYETAYVADAHAEHSHNYTWAQRERRAYGDAAALAIMADAAPSDSWLGGFFFPWIRRSLGQSWKAMKSGAPLRIPQLWMHHYPLMLGQWKGARDGWQHFHAGGEGLQPVL